jgi:hypothetical protein
MITPSLLLGDATPSQQTPPAPRIISNTMPLVLAFKSVKHSSSFKRKKKESAAAQQLEAKDSNDQQVVQVVFSIVFVNSGI